VSEAIIVTFTYCFVRPLATEKTDGFARCSLQLADGRLTSQMSSTPTLKSITTWNMDGHQLKVGRGEPYHEVLMDRRPYAHEGAPFLQLRRDGNDGRSVFFPFRNGSLLYDQPSCFRMGAHNLLPFLVPCGLALVHYIECPVSFKSCLLIGCYSHRAKFTRRCCTTHSFKIFTVQLWNVLRRIGQ
jgi:hypothetical protein